MAADAPIKTLYVSPLGRDSWSGRRADATARGDDGPLATLARARDLLRAGPRAERVRVLLRGGLYPLAETLELGPDDSGVTWAAYRDEVPVLDGGRVITGWQRCAAPAGTPKAARAVLWSARIGKGWALTQLYWNGRELPRSATHEDDWETWPCAPLAERQDELIIPTGSLPAGDPGRCALLNFIPTPYTRWSNAVVPLRHIDHASNRLRFAPVQFHRPDKLTNIPFRLENLAAGLLRPGQWLVDWRAGRVYLWPPEDVDPNLAWISAPYITAAINVAGTAEQPVRDLYFRAITITRTALPSLDRRRPAPAFGAPGAAVQLENVADIRFAVCRLLDLAGNAIAARGQAHRMRVEDCEITRIGGAGIAIAGGLKDPEPPSRDHLIQRNHIHHCGTLFWHSAGIGLGMSENCRVRRNHVHDMPYVAIGSGGVRHRWFAGFPRPRPELADIWRRRGDGGPPTIPAVKALIPGHNRIEGNLVHDVMTRLDDGAAIYCHAGHHNLMRGNLVVRVPRSRGMGLYFDDEEMDSRMIDNVVCRAPDAIAGGHACIHIHNNPRNTIRHNLILGGDRLLGFPSSYGGHRVTGNIFVHTDTAICQHSPLAVAGAGDGRRDPHWQAGRPRMSGNVYWSASGSDSVATMIAGLQAQGLDRDARIVDPTIRLTHDLRLTVRRSLRIAAFDLSRVGPPAAREQLRAILREIVG